MNIGRFHGIAYIEFSGRIKLIPQAFNAICRSNYRSNTVVSKICTLKSTHLGEVIALGNELSFCPLFFSLKVYVTLVSLWISHAVKRSILQRKNAISGTCILSQPLWSKEIFAWSQMWKSRLWLLSNNRQAGQLAWHWDQIQEPRPNELYFKL